MQVFERNKVIEDKKVAIPTEIQNVARKTALKLSDSIGCGNKEGECKTMDPCKIVLKQSYFIDIQIFLLETVSQFSIALPWWMRNG